MLGIKVEGTWCGGLLYADDIVLLERAQVELQVMLDVVGKYAMKQNFSFNSKKSKTMVVSGKGSGGKTKINERMENVEVFKYLGVWFDKVISGNVHLEMREKAEKWRARIGCMSRLNGEMEVERCRLIWELLASSCLEHALKCGGQEGRQHTRT